MNYYIKLIAFTLIIGLCACEKDADVELPTVESKLVINSFISPTDSIVKVTVTMSQPLYNNSNSNNYATVTNANVQINDGINFQTLTYNAIDNYYFVSTTLFPISIGTTYYLNVSTPDGKNVNANTSIPTTNNTLTYTAEKIDNPNFENLYYVETNWNDIAGLENYYKVAFYSLTCQEIYREYYLTNAINVSDKDKDGQLLSETFVNYFSCMNSIFPEGQLLLIHASKEYYLYHSKLSTATNSGGPFSEPVQMYTNINGGFGVFAGYNPYTVDVIL